MASDHSSKFIAWSIRDKCAFRRSRRKIGEAENYGICESMPIQSRYDALTPEGQELVDGYLAYVEFAEQSTVPIGERQG